MSTSPSTPFVPGRVGLAALAAILIGAALVALPVPSEAQRARGNAFFIAPKMQLDAVSQSQTTPPGEEIDVSAYSELVLHLGIDVVDLTLNEDVTLKIQTTNEPATADWYDVATLSFDSQTESAPKRDLVLVDLAGTNPLGQYVRWSISFSDAGKDQDVVFFAKAVGH